MKKIILLSLPLFLMLQTFAQDIYFEPIFANPTDVPVRLYVDITSSSCGCPELQDANPDTNPLYIWTWGPLEVRPDLTLDGESVNINNGDWQDSNENLRMTQDVDNPDLWYYDFQGVSLHEFYNVSAENFENGVSFLLKEKIGSPQDLPEQRSPDLNITLTTQSTEDFSISFETITSEISNPTTITNAGDERIFVTEQPGLIKIFYRDGTLESQPFLDIQSRVQDSGGEQGLLGLAFEPDFCESGRFYVNYTANDGGLVTRVSRFTVDDENPMLGDPDSEEILIQFDQDFGNHNGGHIEFGPDGYLYIATGDGGSGGDPNNRAQDITSLLGKMLRIDVSPENGYIIPSDNPFIFDDFGQDEIWSYGLRNPWKFAFDGELGNIYIADVGQNAFEEVNFEPFNAEGGRNYGWRCYEGNSSYNLSGCDFPEYVFPILDYPHSDGSFSHCSVTGGRVYRGLSFESFSGWFFYTDFCSGVHWAVTQSAGETVEQEFGTIGLGNVRSYGEDVWGEVYLGNNSGIHRLLDPEEGEVLDPIQQDGAMLSPLIQFDGAAYEWFLNGAFQGNPSNLPISETGEYTLIITTESGCTIESTTDITSLSTENIENTLGELVIYPNPTEDMVYVDFEKYRSEAHSVVTYTVDGRLVHTERVSGNRLEMDLTDLSKGIYVLSLLDFSGNSIAQSKLIKK